jgi:RNA-binding protein NOB1
VHLKKNFQWNNRGNVYSIPKPTHGSASGKLASHGGKGGGKNGWGRELVLAEDQKEYARQVEENKRARYRDLMDEDYLPGLLTGDRKGGQGKIRVGAGRNVNAKKR